MAKLRRILAYLFFAAFIALFVYLLILRVTEGIDQTTMRFLMSNWPWWVAMLLSGAAAALTRPE